MVLALGSQSCSWVDPDNILDSPLSLSQMGNSNCTPVTHIISISKKFLATLLKKPFLTNVWGNSGVELADLQALCPSRHYRLEDGPSMSPNKSWQNSATIGVPLEGTVGARAYRDLLPFQTAVEIAAIPHAMMLTEPYRTDSTERLAKVYGIERLQAREAKNQLRIYRRITEGKQ